MATRTDSGWSTFFIITILIAVVATRAFIPPALIRRGWAAERADTRDAGARLGALLNATLVR